MIQLIDVSKTFHSKNGTVHAIRDVNLEIEKSDIFGVIGYSGAGKSTLVRCINLLEYPTSGKILLEGIDLTALDEKALRRQRQKIENRTGIYISNPEVEFNYLWGNKHYFCE